MILNVTKCDVVVYGPGESVGCSVSGTSVILLQQYTYLDLPMTVNLDLNAIVQDRKEKATNGHHAMRQFLMRRHIPGVMRVQMMRSVLVSIATYGYELY